MGRPNILYTAFVAQDFFSAPVKKMGVSSKVLAANVEGVSVAAKSASRSMGMLAVSSKGVALNAFSMFGGSSMAIIGLALALGTATKAAMGFEAQMSNVSTLVDTTVENMGAMSDAVLDLSRKIPKPINDLTEGLYYIRSAGISAANAMDVLNVSGQLAVSGLSTTTEAAKAVTSAMVSFKAQGLSAAQIANSFFLTVREGKTKMDAINESFGATALVVASAGVKLQEFNGAVAALTNTGMDASIAQISVKNTVLGLLKPTEQMKEVLHALNVQTGEQLLTMLGYGGALDAIAEKSKVLNIEQSKLFNRTAFAAFIGLSGQARDQRIADTKEQFEAQDALTGAMEKQMATAAAQMEIFKNKVTKLGISIGNILVPALTKVVDIISPVVEGITSFAKEHEFLLNTIIGGAALFGTYALSVWGVTKAIVVLRSGLALYGKVMGIASVTTRTVTLDMYKNSVATETTALAYNTLAASIGKTLLVATALYYTLKGISYFENKREDKKKWINQHLPQNVKDKYGVVRNFNNSGEVEYNNGKGVQVDEHPDSVLYREIQNTIKGYDSAMDAKEERDAFLKARNDSVMDANQDNLYKQAKKDDSVYFAPPVPGRDTSASTVPSAPYQPKESATSSNVNITLIDKTAGGIGFQADTKGDRAKAVPIQINSTTSRK